MHDVSTSHLKHDASGILSCQASAISSSVSFQQYEYDHATVRSYNEIRLPTLHFGHIPYPTLPFHTLPYPTVPYPTIPYPTLPYPSSQSYHISYIMSCHGWCCMV